MEFIIMQFNAYTETLHELLKETDSDKKEGLINKLNIIRQGFIPVNFVGVDNNEQ